MCVTKPKGNEPKGKEIELHVSCGAQVVVCSCMTSGILRDGGYGSYHRNALVTEPLDFDVVMVDEAGQVRLCIGDALFKGQSCPTCTQPESCLGCWLSLAAGSEMAAARRLT